MPTYRKELQWVDDIPYAGDVPEAKDDHTHGNNLGDIGN